MWLAKPIRSLEEAEKLSWGGLETELPLSQTLCWANAIEAVSGQTFLIFNPEEKVGGIVFNSVDPASGRLKYECINGPFLHWDHPERLPRQIATFAMAISRLDQKFQSITLKPRWAKDQTNHRLSILPMEPYAQSEASTVVVPLMESSQDQYRRLSQRLRRTLQVSWKNGIMTRWEKLTPSLLERFIPEMTRFGESHSFTVPPRHWFEGLLKNSHKGSENSPSFWLATSVYLENNQTLSTTQILVSLCGPRAHYLFGYENRSPGLRASLSTSATAHWEAMRQCSLHGATAYDLNGYLLNAEVDHPYYGVCQFKEQFRGEVIQYNIPEFRIANAI